MANPLTPPPGSAPPAVLPPHDSRKPSHLELFNTFRDYVKHEDDLINNRLNWNFTIQGFLFAAYYFPLQKIADVNLEFAKGSLRPELLAVLNLQGTVRELRIVMVTVAAVALLVSLAICFSVWAARAAITKVEARWHDLYPEYGPSPNKTDTHGSPKDVFPFPGLIGGGNPKAHSAGFQAPLFLPIFFVLGWSFLLCYAVGAALP